MLTLSLVGPTPESSMPSHYGNARQTSSRPPRYADAANDPRTTFSKPALVINAVHHIRAHLANAGGTSRARCRVPASVPEPAFASRAWRAPKASSLRIPANTEIDPNVPEAQ